MLGILKDKKFNYFFSFLVGLFLATLLRRTSCSPGKPCLLYKAPPMKELQTNTYKIGEKCFRFHAVEKTCPQDDSIIEPFEWGVSSR
jgi:hypothetical protein